MLIVEGPDGAGKSTLVNTLKKELGLIVGERATKDRDKLYKVTRQDTYTALGAAVKGDEPVRIWDRLFFSEMVYAPVVGRECEFSERESVFIRRVMNAMGCPIIICMPPFEVVRKNVEGTHQMTGVAENLDKICAHYREGGTSLYGGCVGQLMWYDYTSTRNGGAYLNTNQILDRCGHYMKLRSDRAWG